MSRAMFRAPKLRPLLAPAFRLRMAGGVFGSEAGKLLKWLLTSRETTNMTYELSSINKGHLVALLSHVTGAPPSEVEDCFSELEGDSELANHVAETTKGASSSYKSDPEARYHKRLGWYALVRLLKPRLVIETGVDKGLGSVVLASALLRNHEEGGSGRYIGTDINPEAGFLLAGRYREVAEIRYGDSIESLREIDGPIDLFINDSDHSADYERREYEVIAEKLSERAVIIGDNSHVSDELLKFSRNNDRSFLFWQEVPLDHWYRGAGIGISWIRIAPV